MALTEAQVVILYFFQMMTYRVESPRSGQSRPNIIRISEFQLVSHTKPGERIVMGTYIAVGSIS